MKKGRTKERVGERVEELQAVPPSQVSAAPKTASILSTLLSPDKVETIVPQIRPSPVAHFPSHGVRTRQLPSFDNVFAPQPCC
jgi:hypothetical protein